jgi:hypothetical protein
MSYPDLRAPAAYAVDMLSLGPVLGIEAETSAPEGAISGEAL